MFLDFLWFIIGKIVFFTGMIGEKNSFPKPLPPDEERKYLLLAKQGDEAGKEKLINHNLRLVVHIAKKYAGTMENDDLISVGSIGLIKAVNTYEPDKGSHLATYTARCIENEILMLLRSNKKYRNDVSLSDAVGTDKDGNELSLIDLLFESEDGVFAAAERRIEAERLLKDMSRILTPREYRVICLRYGLKGGRCYPQREVACFLKISRSYISRIEKKAIEKLRSHLKKDDFY